jgi:hypothetical protein
LHGFNFGRFDVSVAIGIWLWYFGHERWARYGVDENGGKWLIIYVLFFCFYLHSFAHSPGNIFLDKRDDFLFDYLSVNENSNEPPYDECDVACNTVEALHKEATTVNCNFSQQVLMKVSYSSSLWISCLSLGCREPSCL